MPCGNLCLYSGHCNLCELFSLTFFKRVTVLQPTEELDTCKDINLINPLSANSDQQQFSPNNIHTLSRDKVMRINKRITIEKML